MRCRVQLYLMIIFIQTVGIAASTDPVDDAILLSLKDSLKNEPQSWDQPDPCVNWEGIRCNNNSHVASIILPSIGLSGQLPGDITNLKELQILDLSYNKGLTGNLPRNIGSLKKLTNLMLSGCSFSGSIPESIGSLEQLVILSLNSNNLFGEIPATIGQLSNLYWLDLADNDLHGIIPASSGDKPGLDMLGHAKHFHLGGNQLSGAIPADLFTANMSLIHLLLENNQLNGSIPDTLGLVRSLEVVRLDNNSLSGIVPKTLSNLTFVSELYLSNNALSGPLPDLTGMIDLTYVDMSNNSFDPSDVPSWFSTLMSLTTLIMERTQIRGQLPVNLFSLPVLQTVILRNNSLNGTLDIGSSHTNQLELIDLQDNSIEAFTDKTAGNFQLILVGNDYCHKGGSRKYCTIPQQSDSSYSSPPDNCSPAQCSPEQVSSPNCKCAYPYTGTIFFRAPSFFNLGPSNYLDLQESLMQSFQSYKLPVDSVSLRSSTKKLENYLAVDLQIFPTGPDHFNVTGFTAIGFVFTNQTYKPPQEYEPYFFNGDSYIYLQGVPAGSSKSSSSSGTIIGAAVGSVLAILLLLAGVYGFRQKKRAEAAKKSSPFASWDPDNSSGDVPQLKGAKFFSFEELKKFTNNFSEINDIGTGSYGKVYRGTLPNGQLVAIKRAQQGSMQGAHEFKTEIELLSRVHHKNVVSLVGFCFEQGEQMLIYEYVPNGTLKDSLSGKSGIRLDWMRRLRIALGAARGLQYLHDLADPPIIHRDIKSNNLLLDESLNAKVADFGLSKPLRDQERGHVTTQVKGTLGYLDPEYYMTQKLTEKSDVYSFGVLLLELITGISPIEKGKYIVREVNQAMIKSKDLCNLHRVLDPSLSSSMPPRSLEKFVDLAMRCVEQAGVNRPTMSDVVKEIENVMELAGLKSASTSTGYEVTSREYNHPYSNESLFAYSGVYPPSNLEPK